MLQTKKRSEIKPGEWFYLGRTECLATTMTLGELMVHVDADGVVSKLEPNRAVQQHEYLFDIPTVTVEINAKKLVAALLLANEKQKHIHKSDNVYMCIHGDEKTLVLEGNEHETYYRAAVNIVHY